MLCPAARMASRQVVAQRVVGCVLLSKLPSLVSSSVLSTISFLRCYIHATWHPLCHGDSACLYGRRCSFLTGRRRWMAPTKSPTARLESPTAKLGPPRHRSTQYSPSGSSQSRRAAPVPRTREPRRTSTRWLACQTTMHASKVSAEPRWGRWGCRMTARH